MIDSAKPESWVQDLCLASDSTCPESLLEQVMADERHPAFGPLHHFTVGAVLITCCRNAMASADRDAKLEADLDELAARSAHVPGATCARWGVCGAAASAGMAYAILRENAPLKVEGWQEGQLLVSMLLERIAHAGAPRCCKRDSRIAVRESLPVFKQAFGVRLARLSDAPRCETAPLNSVCMGNACPFA